MGHENIMKDKILNVCLAIHHAIIVQDHMQHNVIAAIGRLIKDISKIICVFVHQILKSQ